MSASSGRCSRTPRLPVLSLSPVTVPRKTGPVRHSTRDSCLMPFQDDLLLSCWFGYRIYQDTRTIHHFVTKSSRSLKFSALLKYLEHVPLADSFCSAQPTIPLVASQPPQRIPTPKGRAEHRDHRYPDPKLKTSRMTSTSMGTLSASGEGSGWDKASGRLAILDKPKIGTAKRRKHDTKEEQGIQKVAIHTVKKPRYAGKLAALFDLPLDIFYEITYKLRPLDILQLSRVSKHFRSIFMSSNSRHIWVAARRNILDLPECPLPACPADMNEAQYACLLFERVCQACGRPKAQRVDYSLRVRFCSTCFKANVKGGSQLMRSPIGRPYIPAEVFTLLPRAMPRSHRWWGSDIHDGRMANFTSTANTNFHEYYVPEFEMVVRMYRSLQHDRAALDAFMKSQRNMASQIMEHAKCLSEWARTSKQAKTDEENECMKRRRASIEGKLCDLGWEKESFPRWSAQWDAIFYQPRDLTPRIWNAIRPKLECMLQEEKERLLAIRREQGLLRRRDEFLLLWSGVLASTPAEERTSMPDYVDALYLPAVMAMIEEADGQLQITNERWDGFSDSVMLEVKEYQMEIQRDLVALLKAAGSDTQDDVGLQHDDSREDEEFKVLAKPTSLFSCFCDELLGYPAVMHHEHLHVTSCGQLSDLLRCEPQIPAIVAQVLGALSLPSWVTLTDLENLGNIYLCACGHPAFHSPMTFTKLVQHILQENKWYQSMLDEAELDSGYNPFVSLLYNDHSPDDPNPGISFLQVDDLPVATPDKDKEELSITHIPSNYTLCPFCLMIAPHRNVSYDSYNEATYHWMAKHQMDINSPVVTEDWALEEGVFTTSSGIDSNCVSSLSLSDFLTSP